MDDDERESNASSENEQDDVMEDMDEGEGDGENEDENAIDNENDAEEEDNEEEEEEEEEGDGDADGDGGGDGGDASQSNKAREDAGAQKDAQKDGSAGGSAGGAAGSSTSASKEPQSQPQVDDGGSRAGRSPLAESPPGPHPATPRWRPRIAPEVIQARLYDIVPTMAAPQATSINAFAATPDMRFWVTGGSDGYVRKYDGVGTINGKQLLTVAQRHPFVDSVVKAGILMSYWENEEPAGLSGGAGGGTGGVVGSVAGDHVLSPVYSLAVHSQGLWLLSGTEGGAINLSSARHDEGKRIACLAKHSSAVSVLTLLPDEKSVLSGSWDKTVADWDLNNGQVRRRFDGSGGQISAVELRPISGAPVPQVAYVDEAALVKGEYGSTISGNNAQPFRNGALTNGTHGDGGGGGVGGVDVNATMVNGNGVDGSAGGSGGAGGDSAFAQTASPAHESLFGSPAGSLFGEDTMGGNGNVFGDDDDDFGAHSMDIDMHGGEPGHNGDVAMGGTDGPAAAASAPANTAETFGAAGGSDTNGGGADAGAAAQPPSSGAGTDSQEAAGGSVLSNGRAPAATNGVSDGSQSTATAESASEQQMATLPIQGTITVTSSTETQAEAGQQQQPARQSSPSLVFNSAAPPHVDPTQASDQVFLAASMDGTLRIWDRRVQDPVARIGLRHGVPPWCMGACWSPDGNWIYAGRRNGTVEEYSIHHARSGWSPERSLKMPAGSGPVSCVRTMPNGRHLVVASHDILRLYDLRDASAFKGSAVPFLIIPGPPRAGVISQLYIDPSSRFMVSTAGTRGWDGTSTETLVGYEINVAN